MTVTIDESGRVFIPKEIRDRLGVEPGAVLSLDLREGGDGAPTLEVRPEPKQEGGGLVYRDGFLVHTGKLTGDPDVAEILRRQREERARKHAGLDRGSQTDASK